MTEFVRNKTIRIFVSSTFDDMKAERNALQARVFPKLARRCQAAGWSFQAIDLRWGMRFIDTIYLERPYYGVPRMTDELHVLGHRVNHKRVARLMRLMGLQATVPGPHTSRPHPEHRI